MENKIQLDLKTKIQEIDRVISYMLEYKRLFFIYNYMFNWGPTISETPEQMHERREEVPELKNIEAWAWMYAPFKAPNDVQETTEINLTSLNEDINWDKISDENSEISNEDINDNQEQIDNQKALEKFKDHPNYPILERFLNIEVSEWNKLNLLTDSDLLQLSQHLWSTDDIIWDLRNGIKNIDFDDERTFQILSNYLDKTESINKPLEQDNEGKYKLPEEFKWYMVLSGNADNDIVQLIIKNYTRLPDWDNWESNIDNDLYTACEVTLNKIIDWKNFRKTDTYYDAVEDIRNWDLDLRIEALQYINSLVNTSEWMKGWKAKSNFNKIKSEHNLTKKLYIEFKINQIEEQINNSQDLKEQEKLQNKLELLSKVLDSEDHFEWEVFAWNMKVEWENIWNETGWENI